MSDRRDLDVIRLAVAYNTLQTSGELTKLPADLQGKAIPSQVFGHEDAMTGKRGAKASEGGARAAYSALDERSDAMLTRLRHAILAAYPEGDVRIEGYGALGVGANPREDQLRLANLAVKIAGPAKSGELPLVPDLAPEKLAAQAAAQGDALKGKASATASRQSEGDGLEERRRATHRMLQRVKNFVKSFHGPGALSAYGFDVPVPSSRPRLAGVKEDVAPQAQAHA